MTRIIVFCLALSFNFSAAQGAGYPGFGFGRIAGDFTGYATFFGSVFLLLCLVVGIVLTLMGLIQIQLHRKNPKFVPLIQPLGSIFLGILLILTSLVGKYMTPEMIGLGHRQGQQSLTPRKGFLKPERYNPKHRYDIDEPIEIDD